MLAPKAAHRKEGERPGNKQDQPNQLPQALFCGNQGSSRRGDSDLRHLNHELLVLPRVEHRFHDDEQNTKEQSGDDDCSLGAARRFGACQHHKEENINSHKAGAFHKRRCRDCPNLSEASDARPFGFCRDNAVSFFLLQTSYSCKYLIVIRFTC